MDWPCSYELALQMSHTGTLGGYIAYHGGAGSKGEELVLALHPNMEPLACSNYEDAFLALNSFAAEKALVPIEDSLGGSVQAVLDLFLRQAADILFACCKILHGIAAAYKERLLAYCRLINETRIVFLC